MIRFLPIKTPTIISILLLTIFSPPICFAENDTSFLKIPYSSDDIVIDGDLGDWDTYLFYAFEDTSVFLHSPGEFPIEATYAHGIEQVVQLPKSRNVVEVFLCWNLDYLFFAFNIKDGHLQAEIGIGKDNPMIYLNDEIEIFIDTKFDSKAKMDINDYQFMIDILNNTTVFRGDRRLMDSIKISVPKDFGQNIIFSSFVKVLGTLNDYSDIDSGFIVEAKIPFVAVGMIPKSGNRLRLDICVSDQDYLLDSYEKLDGKIQITWPFNWSGYNDFGYPGSWKDMALTGGPDWFDTVSQNLKKIWLEVFIIVLFVSFIILVVLFIRIRRLKKIPAHQSVEPVKVLFVKSEHSVNAEELGPNRRLLQKATEYITDNHTENINSENVAANIGISLRKFQRVTKGEIKCTPTHFIYIVKLNLAAKYIIEEKLNISEITYEFGFSSPSYFSKLFKAHFGMSPNDYKKNAKKVVK
ncbi:MAG: hypothetical protein B6I19_05820 [Bacteroidetes bacterium 4572_114]|nr:MAG: hypothetical protein B6I19_05820 [Bacteroidetes bacterium 4572_114]